jgi:predicted Zn-dependent peptidase
MFERTALPQGPRVISARLPASRSVSIAAYVLAGSRLETLEEAGVAHFMEHITFKGTTAYPSTRAISEAIEGVGGSFNAATDRESTVYWVRTPLREMARGMDVLGELIVRPTLASHEIEGERQVIVEEIRSYLDDPAEYCQILFQQAMFGDGPLGREICGDEAGIRTLPEGTIRQFWADRYRPSNVVVAVAGDIAHDDAVALVERSFGSGNGTFPTFAAAPKLPAGKRYLLGHRDATQAHLAVGVPSLRRDHPDSWILSVLNTVLGDGMSSRLFLSVREEKGLAYDVGSGIADYADAGVLGISAGVDPKHLKRALEAILVELARLRDELVPDEELAKAKAYLSGGLELRMDETRHLASWIGGQEALHDRVMTLDEALAAVAEVSSEDVRRVATGLIRDEVLRLAVVAPPKVGPTLDRSLRLPA